MRKSEHPHNSDEQVLGYIAAALALVDELDVRGELRVAAFEKAVDLFSAKQIVFEQAPSALALPQLRPQ